MTLLVDSLEINVLSEKQEIREMLAALGSGSTEFAPSERRTIYPEGLPGSSSIGAGNQRGQQTEDAVLTLALQNARFAQSRLEGIRSDVDWMSDRADRYRVELHKKKSIAVACLIFLLIGAPLGLLIRRGGLGVAAVAAVAIFIFYWVTLVNGEKLADRGYLEPWIGMWAGNIVTGLFGLLLAAYITYEWRNIRVPRFRKQKSLSVESST